MNIDIPANSASVRQPFSVAGWALDAAATRGSGVDVIHVYAYPHSGAPPVFVGAAMANTARPDVAAYFGPSFSNTGFGLRVRGLAPGGYNLVVYARSTVAGTFAIARSVSVHILPSAMIVMDTPQNGAAVGQGFLVGGWAADFGAASGTGVDLVHVYAYPVAGGAPIFIGDGRVSARRGDVAAAFGTQFLASGFNVVSDPLPRGWYRIVAYGRVRSTGQFSIAATAQVLVR